MKFVYSLLTITIVFALAGCDSPGPSTADESSQSSATEEHDHDHDDHDHDDHDHDDHDHDEHGHGEDGHPESLDQAVGQIKEMGGKITTAFANGTPDDAHDELHEIGHVIECLPELAKKANLSGEQENTVGEITESLMDAFGELDGTLHGGEEVNVDEISKKISTQIEKLQPML